MQCTLLKSSAAAAEKKLQAQVDKMEKQAQDREDTLYELQQNNALLSAAKKSEEKAWKMLHEVRCLSTSVMVVC